MSHEQFQYISCHPLLRQQLGPPLTFVNPTWTEVVNGNGEFKGSIAFPKSPALRAQIIQETAPDEAALYIKDSTGGYLWGGPIITRSWKDGLIEITAVEWRSWFFDVFLGPKTDLTADLAYSWTAQDQLAIARDIVTFATIAGTTDGRPGVSLGSEVSGKLRDLNLKGTDFKFAGELIDTMAQRDGGFEWTIRSIPDNVDGLPRLRLVLGYPELGGTLPGLLLYRTPDGGNITLPQSIVESASGRKTRVWTTGASESLPFANDSDPGISTSGVLLREKVTSHHTVTDRITLASHARSERKFLSPKTNTLTVTTGEDSYPLDEYRAGDRVRLIYQDDFYDLDLPAARILARTVNPRGLAGTVDLLLDLYDFEPPEVDSGGAV